MDLSIAKGGTSARTADSVVLGGRLVNVVTREVYKADVAIHGGRFVSVGDVSSLIGPRTRRIDASGAYMVPGLIDGHIHCEVTKLSMTRFASLVLPRGTTAIATSFDQIAGVAGLRGVRSFLREATLAGLKIIYGIPSKLPYTTPSSTLHHTFGPAESRIAARWRESAGVWETGPEMILGSPDGGVRPDRGVLETIDIARKNRLMTFGSAPLLRGDRLSEYLSTGIRSDHESYTPEEALEKLRNGAYVMIRESSVVHFLRDNIKVVTESGVDSRRVAFCTDDVTVSDVLAHGHVDHMVRKAIEYGVEPLAAIQMATLNAAELYRVDDFLGSISPGRNADMLLVDDLRRFKVRRVVTDGVVVASDGEMLRETRPPHRTRSITHTMNVKHLSEQDLAVKTTLSSRRVRVISMSVDRDAPFVRKKRLASLIVKDGTVEPDPALDVAYVAVVERHKGTGSVASAFISGYGIREGAIASSVSPDDNNILCIGSSVSEMARALRAVIEMRGGQVVVGGGRVTASMALAIGGIVSDDTPPEVAQKERELDAAARRLGCKLKSPFMSMIFLSITAIPDYAIIDRGLVDTTTLKVIDPVLGPA
jgi:adenine deaminase